MVGGCLGMMPRPGRDPSAGRDPRNSADTRRAWVPKERYRIVGHRHGERVEWTSAGVRMTQYSTIEESVKDRRKRNGRWDGSAGKTSGTRRLGLSLARREAKGR